ncbi:MAG TPA: glycerate kinase, partial [Cyanobacteria bacterium UBA9579]|nr:glycerate kinase [Cyanobacteria bacterium UBA9579]
MKVLIAPNYFKGSLSAIQAADIISDALKLVYPDIITIKAPLADGGDGTVEAVHLAQGGELLNTRIHDPLDRPIDSKWLKLPNLTAIIEAAKANGLSLLKEDEYNPFIATTYGVGEFINDALSQSCNKIIVGVGGSATNDAGFGALKSLGVKFLDKNNQEISNNVLALKNLAKIDISGINPALKHAQLLIATDVTNPLTGKDGASYTYAAQKGAKEENLKVLDDVLYHFADICTQELGIDKRYERGTGAAGGLSYGLAQISGAKIVDGFDTVADLINLEEKIKLSDIVITGEGRIDKQTLWGKAPCRVAQMAKKYNKPCIAIAGSVEKDIILDSYFRSIYSLVNQNTPKQEAINHAEELLYTLIKNNYKKLLL